MSFLTRLQNNKILKNLPFLSFIAFLISSSVFAQENETESKEKVHSVYITSNTALRSKRSNDLILGEIVKASLKEEDSATLVLIGNIVP
ncbi:MAG: hypothetical protein KJO51_07420, partial [Gramella sp.]|nr:hypothetical protein [Christiangramia sp.]